MFKDTSYSIYGIKNAMDHPHTSEDYVRLHATIPDSNAYATGNRVTLSVGHKYD